MRRHGFGGLLAKDLSFVPPRPERVVEVRYDGRFAGQPQANVFVWDDLAIELESRGSAALIDHANGYVAELFGTDAAAAITNAVVHPWGTDPWALGSYSIALPGRAGAHSLLATPLDNKVFFAGEAVSDLSYGTLHGAYLSGQLPWLQSATPATPYAGLGASP